MDTSLVAKHWTEPAEEEAALFFFEEIELFRLEED